MKKRDISIELVRVIACFLVIGAHIQLGTRLGDEVLYRRLFGSSLIADNVPLFFVIAGYFLFSKTDQMQNNIMVTYKNKLISYFKNVLLPILILIIIIANIEPFIKNQCGLLECTYNVDNTKNYLYQFIFNQTAYDRAGHFWYICSYVKILVWFPALALLCQKDEQVTKIRRLLLGMVFAVILMNDFEYLLGEEIGNFEAMTFDQNMLYVVLGYELYYIFNYSKLTVKQLRKYGLFIFIGAIALKMILQSIMYSKFGINATSRFMWLQCGPCYLSSVGTFIFWHSFKDKINGKVISSVISFIGKYSLYIYMFHAMVIDKSIKVKGEILEFCKYGKNFGYDLLYYLLYGGFVLIISLALGFVFERIYSLFLYIVSKIPIYNKNK